MTKKWTLLSILIISLSLLAVLNGCGESAPPPPPPIFSENFESYSNAPWAPPPATSHWEVISGTTWEIVTDNGTNVLGHYNVGNDYVIYNNYTGYNYTCSVKISMRNTASNTLAGIIGRYLDSNNYYCLTLSFGDGSPGSSNTLKLNKCHGGTFTTVAETNIEGRVSFYQLTLSFNGLLITGTANELGSTSKTVVTYGDNGSIGVPIVTGKAGLTVRSTFVGDVVYFDDMVIKEP